MLNFLHQQLKCVTICRLQKNIGSFAFKIIAELNSLSSSKQPSSPDTVLTCKCLLVWSWRCQCTNQWPAAAFAPAHECRAEFSLMKLKFPVPVDVKVPGSKPHSLIHKICLLLTKELISVGQLGLCKPYTLPWKGGCRNTGVHPLCTWSASITWILYCQLIVLS